MQYALVQDALLGNQPDFLSVFCTPKFPGWVYVEVYSASALDELCRNKSHVFRRKTYLVPTPKRAQLLSFVVPAPEAIKGGWVQIKAGRYRQDIGQVLSEEENREFLILKVVPRVLPKDTKEKLAKGIQYKPTLLHKERAIERFGEGLVNKTNNRVVLHSCKYMNSGLRLL